MEWSDLLPMTSYVEAGVGPAGACQVAPDIDRVRADGENHAATIGVFHVQQLSGERDWRLQLL